MEAAANSQPVRLALAARRAARDARRAAEQRTDEAWVAGRRTIARLARRHGWDYETAFEVGGEVVAAAMRTWRAGGGASLSSHVVTRLQLELGRRMAAETSEVSLPRIAARRLAATRRLAAADGREEVTFQDARAACLDDGVANPTDETVADLVAAAAWRRPERLDDLLGA